MLAIIGASFKDTDNSLEWLESLGEAELPQASHVYLNVMEEDEAAYGALSLPFSFQVRRLEQNLGFGYAINQGVKRAMNDGAQRLVIMNTDTLVRPGFVDPLLAQLKKKTVGVVSPLIYFASGYEFHHDSYTEKERGKVVWYAGGKIDWENVYAWHWGVNEVDHGHFYRAEPTDFATGCCMAVSRTVIEQVGMMDERYFLYMEDTDWSVRIKKAGYKLLFEPSSVIWHKNAGSTGGPGSALHQYYQARNRILFARQYAPLRSKVAVYREAFNKMRGGSESQAVRQGLIDGLWGRGGIWQKK
jgi:GT2 family glycosyltransferase